MRDIAAACGVSDAAIFYYFPEKGDILLALVSCGIEMPAVPSQQAGSVADPLPERIVDEALRTYDQNRDLIRIVMARGLAGDERSRSQFRDWTDFWVGRLSPVIEQVSSVTQEVSRQVARQIVLLVFMAVQDRLLLRRDDRLTPAERRSDLRDFLVRAVERLLR